MIKTLAGVARRLAAGALLALAIPSAAVQAADAPPLVVASANGEAATASKLLAEGADPDSHDQDGLTALNWAAYGGHAEIVRLLLAKHAAVDSHGNPMGWTPLMNAANGGYDDVVALLLAAGAAVNIASANGDQAIWFAAAGQHAKTVALLRAHGATGDVAPIVAPQALCDAGKKPLSNPDIAWQPLNDKPGHSGCNGTKHAFPGNPGAIIMYTYAVDGDQTGARTLSITVLVADTHLSKELINATLQPLLTSIFTAAGRGAVPANLSKAAASLANLQADSALGRVTARYKPGDDKRNPTIGAEYRLSVQLK